MISTRRLVHIVKAYSIFGDKTKAIEVCLNRFDDETKQSFIELYDKVDVDFNIERRGTFTMNSWSLLYDELDMSQF